MTKPWETWETREIEYEWGVVTAKVRALTTWEYLNITSHEDEDVRGRELVAMMDQIGLDVEVDGDPVDFHDLPVNVTGEIAAYMLDFTRAPASKASSPRARKQVRGDSKAASTEKTS